MTLSPSDAHNDERKYATSVSSDELRRLQINDELFDMTMKLGHIGAWELFVGAKSPIWSAEVFRIHEVPLGEQPPLEEAINFYAPEARPIIEAAVAHAMQDGTPWDLELPFITAKGNRLWVRTMGRVEFKDGKPHRLYGAFQDISSRKHIEMELERYSMALHELHRIGSDPNISFDKKVSKLLTLAVNALDMHYGTISQIQGHTVTVRWSFAKWGEPIPVNSRYRDTDLYCTEVIAQSSAVMVHDVENSDLKERSIHSDLNWRAYSGSPINTTTTLYGALCLGRDEIRTPFTEQEVDLLQVFTQWLGQEISRNQSEADLASARDAANAANRAKSTFLATMSHEIRTPLNGIMGMTQVLQSTVLNTDQREQVETIQQSGEALGNILNQILDLAKIEAGKMSLTQKSFSPYEVLKSVTNLLEPTATHKHLELDLSNEWPEQRLILGDEFRFRQIGLNLINNAIKFTDTGGVHVRLFDKGSDAGQTLVRFEVHDSGVGIDDEVAHRLFQAFTQVGQDQAGRPEGTGLGLTIVKELAELMGGSVGFLRNESGGTTFWVEIKFKIGDHTIFEVKETTKNLPLDKSLRVLLVEDNRVNQMVGKRLLENLNCTVSLAENGHVALEAWKDDVYDIIFMDCEMPIMDGFEATEEIRKLETNKGTMTPIVAVTANAFASDKQRCLDAGMDAFIPKPIKRDDLIAALTEWCGE